MEGIKWVLAGRQKEKDRDFGELCKKGLQLVEMATGGRCEVFFDKKTRREGGRWMTLLTGVER